MMQAGKFTMMLLRRIAARPRIVENSVYAMSTERKSSSKKTSSSSTGADFTKEEIEEFKDIFDKYDCEHIGSVDRWEFNNFVRATMGRRMNAVDLHKIFSLVDSNHDDRIQFDELLSHLRNRLSKPEEKKIRKAFNIFDKDQDGRLTLSETRLALLFLGEDYGNPRVRKVFIKLDEDNDGEINYKDFNKLLQDRERSQLNR